jgi:hypothetical protein
MTCDSLSGSALNRSARSQRPSPEDGFHACDKLPGTERLDDIIIRPQCQPRDTVDLFSPGGQHQDGNIGELSDLSAHLPPVHDGEHQIQDDENGLMPLCQLDSLLAIISDDRFESFSLEIEYHQRGGLLIVLHDQNRTLGIG